MVLAVGIFSGGLDSLLSAKILMEQGITPTLLTFVSPFFSPEKALESAAQLAIDPVLLDITEDLINLVKLPVHGRGRNLNPCIDCHGLMFKKAWQYLAETGEEGFLFSGEVLGQRPLSQTKSSLDVVARLSGQKELVLRPLSAKFLAPTLAEEKGWVDREKLLGFSGRSRSPQIELAKRFGFTYPTPAGGCLLTDANFSSRLKMVLENYPDSLPPVRLLEMLKRGRLFFAKEGEWIFVGRNQADNLALEAQSQAGDVIFHLEGRPGPLVICPILKSENLSLETRELAMGLAAAYGDAKGQKEATVKVETVGGTARFEEVTVGHAKDFVPFMAVF